MMAKWDDAQARKLLGLSSVAAPVPSTMSSDINIADAKKWVYYLSALEFQGRSTGSAEEKVYTKALADAFKSWGLQGGAPDGGFFETFEFTSGVGLGSNNSLEVVGSYKNKYTVSKDFEPLSFSKVGEFREAPIVFAGYGIKAPASDKEPAYDSYKGLEVKGKWVLIFNDLPENVEPQRRQYLNLYSRLQHKITVAKNEGAVGILVTNGILSDVPEKFGSVKFEGALSENSLAVLRLSTDAAAALVKYAYKDLGILQRDLDKGEMVEGFVIPSAYMKAKVDLEFKKAKIGRAHV